MIFWHKKQLRVMAMRYGGRRIWYRLWHSGCSLIHRVATLQPKRQTYNLTTTLLHTHGYTQRTSGSVPQLRLNRQFHY